MQDIRRRQRQDHSRCAQWGANTEIQLQFFWLSLKCRPLKVPPGAYAPPLPLLPPPLSQRHQSFLSQTTVNQAAKIHAVTSVGLSMSTRTRHVQTKVITITSKRYKMYFPCSRYIENAIFLAFALALKFEIQLPNTDTGEAKCISAHQTKLFAGHGSQSTCYRAPV